MFTGIITGVGRIDAVHDLESSLPDSPAADRTSNAPNLPTAASPAHADFGKRLTIHTPPGYLADVGLGDSIALNGACMTVTRLDLDRQTFCIDISSESLSKTAGLDQTGPINLEKAIRANDRLGGHIVAGHVDGIGQVTHFAQRGESWELRVQVPRELARFVAYKGSITINGVSLTVNSTSDSAQGTEVSINLIPHTVQNTALGNLIAGSQVNLEIDLIARYVERMLTTNPQLHPIALP